jgi:hypothetical protein
MFQGGHHVGFLPDGVRVRRHHLADRRGRRVKPCRDHAKHDIAPGNNPRERPIPDYQNRAYTFSAMTSTAPVTRSSGDRIESGCVPTASGIILRILPSSHSLGPAASLFPITHSAGRQAYRKPPGSAMFDH